MSTEAQIGLARVIRNQSRGSRRVPQACIRAAMSVGRRDLVVQQFAVLAAYKAINEVMK